MVFSNLNLNFLELVHAFTLKFIFSDDGLLFLLWVCVVYERVLVVTILQGSHRARVECHLVEGGMPRKVTDLVSKWLQL